MDHMYTQAADGSGSLQGVWFGELLQLTGAEGLLLAVSVCRSAPNREPAIMVVSSVAMYHLCVGGCG